MGQVLPVAALPLSGNADRRARARALLAGDGPSRLPKSKRLGLPLKYWPLAGRTSGALDIIAKCDQDQSSTRKLSLFTNAVQQVLVICAFETFATAPCHGVTQLEHMIIRSSL